VIYCRGSENLVADFLSRNPEGRFREERPVDNLMISCLTDFTLIESPHSEKEGSLVYICRMEKEPEFKAIIRDIAKAQADDAECQRLRDKYDGHVDLARFKYTMVFCLLPIALRHIGDW
jgi:hypothetical protein